MPFLLKSPKYFGNVVKIFLDQSCSTLSHCKLFYNCNKLVPFKALLFAANILKFSTCWLQWLFKNKNKNQAFQSQSLSNVDMNYMIKLTQISLALIPVQPFLSTSQGPTFDFPPLFTLSQDSLQRGAQAFE